MDFFHHLAAVAERLVQKVHGVPKVIVTPVLPVLHNTVERHAVVAVPLHHLQQFLAGLVALTALPVAEGPERKHRHLARQLAHLRVHTVGRAAQHEIIVDGVAHLGREGHAIGAVAEVGARVVVPVHSPALEALHHILEVFQVALLHVLAGAAPVQQTVLYRAQSVEGLVFVELVHLRHTVGSPVRTRLALLEAELLLLEQVSSFAQKLEQSAALVDVHGEGAAAQLHPRGGFRLLHGESGIRLQCHHHAFPGGAGAAGGITHHMNDFG